LLACSLLLSCQRFERSVLLVGSGFEIRIDLAQSSVVGLQECNALCVLRDLLILLREKTEGNRSHEENRILEEVLYDLQLRYVHATKKS